jgi:hypothetical protein
LAISAAMGWARGEADGWVCVAPAGGWPSKEDLKLALKGQVILEPRDHFAKEFGIGKNFVSTG